MAAPSNPDTDAPATSSARVVWKGAISFGLVHIPVALYTATTSSGVDFDWLDRRTMEPVGYKRINKKTGKEIAAADIVKGIEVEDGQYVVLSADEIKAAFPKTTQTIEIETFIQATEIPFVYLERPYYLAPINRGDKVYALLREALLETGRVEDHPISYNDFEGQIPAGQYGGGRVIIWDRGTWSPTPGHDPLTGLATGNLKFILHGTKLQGGWALVRLKDGGAKPNWLLIKEKDAAARPDSEFDVTEALPDSVGPTKLNTKSEATLAPGPQALPDAIAPQLATLVTDPPTDPSDWLWELKFDGYRLLARIDAGRVQLFTRNGLDWTARMPALARALATLPIKNAWIDGEVVMPDADGLPDFGALQNAFDGSQTDTLVYYLFDLLHLDGQDWRSVALLDRRARLADLLDRHHSPVLRLSERLDADPHSLLASACRLGMEGIIGKRADAAYRSGRSSDWIKLKCGQSDEFIIVGFTAGQGARAVAGDLGALVLAAPHADGGLRWVGNVGSGFDGRTLAQLKERLTPLVTRISPLTEGRRAKATSAITWVRPELVAQVAYGGITREGRLRQPVFQGLREDKPVSELRADAVARVNQEVAQSRSSRPAMKSGKLRTDGPSTLAGQVITNPERVIDPQSGTTKLDLARYYATVAPLILPHLAKRPVALLRTPDGLKGEQFFQKHLEGRQPPGVTVLDPKLDPGHAGLLEITDAAALLGVVHMNTLELHTWNATHDKIERPDRFVLDLDPGEGVAWPQVQEAAQLVHTLLTELGLVPFLKTSGGKGLHVVTPIKRLYDWDTAKAFSKQLVEHLAALMPDRFTAVSGPRNRIGKIYPDYLRNGRGATTVSAWSARARPGLGVSVPVAWDELPQLTGSAHWMIGNIEARLRVGNAPWDGYAAAARSIGAAVKVLEKART